LTLDGFGLFDTHVRWIRKRSFQFLFKEDQRNKLSHNFQVNSKTKMKIAYVLSLVAAAQAFAPQPAFTKSAVVLAQEL